MKKSKVIIPIVLLAAAASVVGIKVKKGNSGKITNNMINDELKLQGRLMSSFMGLIGEKQFKTMEKMARKGTMGKTSNNLICKEVMIPREDGTKLRICIYTSLKPSGNAPGLLWIHGGGYLMGVPEMDLPYIEKFIDRTNCVVISPDYTLSVEKPYPAALNDCYASLLWMKENASMLGIRNDQLFVGGESAGGGLTAATTLYARDKKEVNVAFQMPLYPMIDDRMETESMKGNNAPVWNEKINRAAWKKYLGDLYLKEDVPKYAAPSREIDYSNLPPTYTFVGSIEPFYDETINYISALKDAGVPAEVDIYEGCYHGFNMVCPKASISLEANRKMVEKFNYATINYFKPQP